LAPVEPILEPEPTIDFTSPYNSLQLLDKILIANRTSPDLIKLYTKAKFEQEKTWQLKDGLLLRYRKLYVLNSILINKMPLRTAIICEAYN
jgi:hypothetical protein